MGASMQMEPSDFTHTNSHRQDRDDGTVAKFYVSLHANHLPNLQSFTLAADDPDEIRQVLDELRGAVDALDPAIGNQRSVILPFRLRTKPAEAAEDGDAG